MLFLIFICFFILLRLMELYISARNEKWLLQNGAKEYGKEHYPFIVLLHTFFILSLIAEYFWRSAHEVNFFFLLLFLLLIIIKALVISNLGKYWNTKIYKIPGARPVNTGIYKYIKHPNYIIVICEIAFIPLAFNLYFTAVAFTLLNALMLTIRIKKENEVLAL